VPPGMGAAALHEVSFTLGAGSALGVIGPSGSGKTSLARALVGVWKPVRGAIRLDGATLDQWSQDVLGRFIGYLPQEVELFDGTVAENIARFEPEADPTKLIAAATAAGVHDVILRLPQGYKTQVGEGGGTLSGGQRQRIALARALYGDPFLVVLDEPNSNLDALGEEALTRAIRAVRARAGIAVVIAHRPSAVAAVDHLLVLNEGRVQAFGPRDEILQRVRPPAPAQPPAPVAGEAQVARRRRSR
jgi:ATP-binding cassette, subfamily C, type I secretion system permease/ATPase